jgi:Uma2 family endonuclease
MIATLRQRFFYDRSMNTITLDVQPIELTDEQFFKLCQANRDLRFERSAAGELLIMAPTGWKTGNWSGRITQQLFNWVDSNNLGIAFDSSTGVRLPNGADRSPDASWVRWEKLEALNPDPTKFLPLSPDFVVELRSTTDKLKTLQNKMQEYIDNGVQLGWLIDPKHQRVEIYRQGQEVKILESPISLSGEDVLPGFVLSLAPLWNSV